MATIEEQVFAKLWEYLTPERKELLQNTIQLRTKFITLAIDDVKKEHNSGALIRTCESFGIQEVSIVDPEFRKKSAKNISKGSQKWVDQNLFDEWGGEKGCLQSLKKNGFQIVATSPIKSDVRLEEFLPTTPTAFLFGNEAEGLPQELIDGADVRLHIPTQGFSESLNVSVSAGIILHRIMKKLRTHPPKGFELPEEEKISILMDWAVKSIPRGEQIRNRIENDLS